jgi:hypothetical protein
MIQFRVFIGIVQVAGGGAAPEISRPAGENREDFGMTQPWTGKSDS